MNNKILAGSIISIIILILVSFTSVVGLHSVKSTSAINSPLFGIRTRRAIGKGQQDITPGYLGHGVETNIHISRMRRAEQVQKAIEIISNMDDKAFSKIVAWIINQEKLDDKEVSDVLQVLNYLRLNPNDMKYYDTKNNPRDDTFEYLTCWGFPGCLIKTTKYMIQFLLLFIIIGIMASFTITGCNCQTLLSGFCCDVL